MILRTSTVISASLSFRVTGVKTCIEKVKKTNCKLGKKKKEDKTKDIEEKIRRDEIGCLSNHQKTSMK